MGTKRSLRTHLRKMQRKSKNTNIPIFVVILWWDLFEWYENCSKQHLCLIPLDFLPLHLKPLHAKMVEVVIQPESPHLHKLTKNTSDWFQLNSSNSIWKLKTTTLPTILKRLHWLTKMVQNQHPPCQLNKEKPCIISSLHANFKQTVSDS